MIKAIDFFCGAGGLTRGLLDAGVNVLAGVDIDERLRDTYERNNSPSRFMNEDIKEINIRSIRERLGIDDSDTTLYAACTPCQPFSTLNSMSKRKDDKRKTLLLEFAEIVRECPPDYIVVENVPGLNGTYGKKIHDKFLSILRQCGFSEPSAGLLDAKDYGVPQTRKRFILVASRRGSISLPEPTHGKGRENSYITVRDAIERYPRIADGEESNEHPNHYARKLQPHHKTIVDAVPKDGGNRADIEDTSILLKCHQENPKAHRQVFGRMAWDKPSPTMTSRCTDVYCGRFIHPEQDRGISLREAAALQTFPDDYEFFGPSFLNKAGQIGNAVPVKLAEQLGQSIVNSI